MSFMTPEVGNVAIEENHPKFKKIRYLFFFYRSTSHAINGFTKYPINLDTFYFMLYNYSTTIELTCA
jgi:hypothetical protein